MRIVLVGPGALGCLLACRLAQGITRDDAQVILLDHNPTRAQALTDSGLNFEEDGRQQRFAVPVFSTAQEVAAADILILCVKSYDLPRCLQSCRPLLQAETLLLFMQNGIGHLTDRGSAQPATATFGTTTEGATLLGPGHVRHGGRGLTQLGFLDPAGEHAASKLGKLAEAFNRGNLQTRVVDDIRHRLWAKLMANVAINGLTATLDCANGKLLARPGIPERMAALVAETVAVAQASNIAVQTSVLETVYDICRKTAPNISSMLQDVRARRRTEIDAINGAVVAAAARCNIPVPQNRLLVAQVKELEARYLAAAIEEKAN